MLSGISLSFTLLDEISEQRIIDNIADGLLTIEK